MLLNKLSLFFLFACLFSFTFLSVSASLPSSCSWCKNINEGHLTQKSEEMDNLGHCTIKRHHFARSNITSNTSSYRERFILLLVLAFQFHLEGFLVCRISLCL
uniref:Secreted protein n=1 Tax=Octopus bimaculoides TaxID=37653 RepID=A0A0L8IHP2_OCTBM